MTKTHTAPPWIVQVGEVQVAPNGTERINSWRLCAPSRLVGSFFAREDAVLAGAAPCMLATLHRAAAMLSAMYPGSGAGETITVTHDTEAFLEVQLDVFRAIDRATDGGDIGSPQALPGGTTVPIGSRRDARQRNTPRGTPAHRA